MCIFPQDSLNFKRVTNENNSREGSERRAPTQKRGPGLFDLQKLRGVMDTEERVTSAQRLDHETPPSL